MEKEEKLKVLRKKDQAAKLDRVSNNISLLACTGTNIYVEERRSKDCSREEGEEVAEGACV